MNKLNLISLIILTIIQMVFASGTKAQDIAAPEFSLGGSVAPILCVNQNVPNREAIVQVNVLFEAGTQFILELSDENGVFADPPTQLVTFTTPTAIPAGREIEFPSFAIPTDSAGEDYSIRVRVPVSGGDDIVGTVNENIAIYYFDFSEGVTLTGPNIEANTVALCQGETTSLITQPDIFPEYIWSLNGSVIAGVSGSTLENVSQAGTYTVQVNFGSCNAAFNFDTATVQVVDFNQTTVRINELSPQEFCPSDVKILTCSITDPAFTYEWLRNGEIQPDLSGPSVSLGQSNFGGTYEVRVIATETCAITTLPVEVINLGSDILTQPPPELILLPTQTSLELSVTTNAPPGSSIIWSRNDIPLTVPLFVDDPGALSIEITSIGLYRAEIISNDVCMDTLEAITEVFEPVGFRTVITSLLDCEADSGTIGLENLFGITSSGAEIPILPEQFSFFDFEWFLGTTSTGITEPTLSVTQDNVGEIYALEATLRNSTFDTARSDDLVVEILSDNFNIDATSTAIPFGQTVTLSVQQSSNYTYEWFRVVDDEDQLIVDGGTITGQGTNTLETGETGQYFVRITVNNLEDCSLNSNPIVLSEDGGQTEIIPNIVTPNSDGINDNWLLPASLFNQQDVEVTIYNIRGQVDFSVANYQNNWPRENSKSAGQDPIYYYIITKNNSVVRKGSITVMR